jgi:hypothetical protein
MDDNDADVGVVIAARHDVATGRLRAWGFDSKFRQEQFNAKSVMIALITTVATITMAMFTIYRIVDSVPGTSTATIIGMLTTLFMSVMTMVLIFATIQLWIDQSWLWKEIVELANQAQHSVITLWGEICALCNRHQIVMLAIASIAMILFVSSLTHVYASVIACTVHSNPLNGDLSVILIFLCMFGGVAELFAVVFSSGGIVACVSKLIELIGRNYVLIERDHTARMSLARNSRVWIYWLCILGISTTVTIASGVLRNMQTDTAQSYSDETFNNLGMCLVAGHHIMVTYIPSILFWIAAPTTIAIVTGMAIKLGADICKYIRPQNTTETAP